MCQINTLSTAMYAINIESNTAPMVCDDIQRGQWNEWVEGLVGQITRADQRSYVFPSVTTEVRAAIGNIIANNDLRASQNSIAQRLLRSESDAQEKYGHLNNIQKGSLILVHLEGEGENTQRILIAKVEHEPFIDEIDLEKKTGLPFKKQIYKTCSIIIDDGEISDILVSDSNGKVSDYWHNNFLEAEPATTNDINTRKAYKEIERYLKRHLKERHKSDYNILINNMIGYFRSNTSFSNETMLDTVIGDYTPNDSNVDIDKLKTGLGTLHRTLSEKRTYDLSFEIVQNEIKGKYKRVIKLSDKIHLGLKEDIENIGTAIRGHVLNGVRGVFVESEDGYSEFRGSQIDDDL